MENEINTREMKSSKKLYWIIPIIIVTTPIVVNYILTREIVCNYDVAGTGVDWIKFYGSFLGSALSALIAYYVLLKTMDYNKREWIVNQKQKECEWLREDLSMRISQINVVDIFRVFLFHEEFNIKEELNRLTGLLYEYKSLSNSSMLKYGLEEDEKCKEFFEEYNNLIVDIVYAINSIMKILTKYLYVNDFTSLKYELSEMDGSLKELNKRPGIVYKRAEKYYQSKLYELQKCINQIVGPSLL